MRTEISSICCAKFSRKTSNIVQLPTNAWNWTSFWSIKFHTDYQVKHSCVNRSLNKRSQHALSNVMPLFIWYNHFSFDIQSKLNTLKYIPGSLDLFTGNLANFKSMNEFVEKKVEYPDIQLISSPEIQYSFENNKFAERLKQIFIRFDAICRFHEVSVNCS